MKTLPSSVATRHRPRSPALRLLILAAALAAPAAPGAAQQDGATDPARAAVAEAEARYALPPASVQELFRRDTNHATLDRPSPDGRRFLVPLSTELSTLERMAETTYRLAELEIRPRTDRLWHLDTYGIYGLRVYSLDDREYRDVQLPADIFVSDVMWSLDGARLAFLAHLAGGTEVWTADAATGRASRLSRARVLATIGTSAQGQGSRPSRMLQWTTNGSVITLVVPPDRGPEPPRPAVPDAPMVRLTRDAPTSTRTFPYLLRNNHDAALFEHYTRSRIAELAPGRRPRLIGPPAIYESISLSPDGRHILATSIERPFSFITSHNGFPRRTVVLDLDGNVLATLEERPLREGGGGGFGRDDARAGARAWAWRPDGAGLSFLMRADNGRGDRIMLLPPPFDTAAARVMAASEERLRDVTYSADGAHAFATVTRSGQTGIAYFDLRQPEPERRMLVDFHSTDSIISLPGELVTGRTHNGIPFARISSDGAAAFLEGPGYRPDFRPQPFVDRVALADGATTRVFEGSRDTFDRPLVPLDPDFRRLIVSRESRTMFPDSYLRAEDGGYENLTRNTDPFPEITAARRIDFSFARRDGLEVQGRISLPVDYREGTRVPAIFWTYPREYTEPDDYRRAAVRARNHNAFTHVTWLRWSDIWLTQGYALVYPDIPIIGENYNDTYISNMVDAMYGALRAVERLGFVDMDRIGHGGHSYGAFATANLLAHSPFFKAGIAGDGAYNRSLTPSGFQAERRSIWEAPHTYIEMSPFFKADQIETPLLMYHGGDDNNTGTWPIQSERLIHALTTLGKTAALYVYPFESHTPRAIANNLDMWARWLEWFDRYVKGARVEDVRATSDAGTGGT